MILDKYLEDIQNGRACTRKELLQQHPDLKDALTEYLSSIDMVAGLGVGDDLLTQKVGDLKSSNRLAAVRWALFIWLIKFRLNDRWP